MSLHFRQEFCGPRSQAKELSVWVHLHRGPQGHPYLSGPRGSGGLPGSSPGQWQRRPRASEAPAAASGPMVPAARESGSPTVGAQSRSPAERAHLPARTAPGLKPGAGRGGDSGKLRSPTGEGGGRAGDRRRGTEEAEGGVEKTWKAQGREPAPDSGEGCVSRVEKGQKKTRRGHGRSGKLRTGQTADTALQEGGWRLCAPEVVPAAEQLATALGAPIPSRTIPPSLPLGPLRAPPGPPVSPFPRCKTSWVWGRFRGSRTAPRVRLRRLGTRKPGEGVGAASAPTGGLKMGESPAETPGHPLSR